MDDKQIAFIICSNDMLYYLECVRYLMELDVPEGYSTDFICVQEAESMTQGYNAGMQASNAKYKVYLHQDTFILNKRFIYDILEVFQNDASIGMLGMIGGTDLSSDAKCYVDWNVGKVNAYAGAKVYIIELYQNKDFSCIPVLAIDGLLMATQYDISWREDVLDKWDFYDVSQSLEMQLAGYKVVVPYQDTTWCYHDCGPSNLRNYDIERKKLIQMYPQIFTGEVNEEELQEGQEILSQLEQVKDSFVKLIVAGAYNELVEMAIQMRKILGMRNRVLEEIINFAAIYEKENINNVSHSTIFDWRDWNEMYKYYKWARLVIMRIGWGREDDRVKVLKEDIRNGIFSEEAILLIANMSLGGKIDRVKEFIENK